MGESKPFSSPEEAIEWGYSQGVFRHRQHATNAYQKLKQQHRPKTAREMAALWRADVARREVEASDPAGWVDFAQQIYGQPQTGNEKTFVETLSNKGEQ